MEHDEAIRNKFIVLSNPKQRQNIGNDGVEGDRFHARKDQNCP